MDKQKAVQEVMLTLKVGCVATRDGVALKD